MYLVNFDINAYVQYTVSLLPDFIGNAYNVYSGLASLNFFFLWALCVNHTAIKLEYTRYLVLPRTFTLLSPSLN